MVLLRRCCCFSIETGTKIIGTLSLMNVMFGLIIASIWLSNLDSNEDEIRINIKNIIMTNIPNDENNNKDYYEMVNYMTDVIILVVRKFCIVTILNACLSLLAIALLFIGLFKKRYAYLLPFMIIDGISLIGIGICSLIIIILLFVAIGQIPVGLFIIGIITVLIINSKFEFYSYIHIYIYIHLILLPIF